MKYQKYFIYTLSFFTLKNSQERKLIFLRRFIIGNAYIFFFPFVSHLEYSHIFNVTCVIRVCCNRQVSVQPSHFFSNLISQKDKQAICSDELAICPDELCVCQDELRFVRTIRVFVRTISSDLEMYGDGHSRQRRFFLTDLQKKNRARP